MSKQLDKFNKWQENFPNNEQYYYVWEAAWNARQHEIHALKSEIAMLHQMIREKNHNLGLG